MEIRHLIAYALIALLLGAFTVLILRWKAKRERRRHYRRSASSS